MLGSASDVSRLHRQWTRRNLLRAAWGTLARYLDPRPIVGKQEVFQQESQLAAPLAAGEIRDCVSKAVGVPDDTRHLALRQFSEYNQVADQSRSCIQAHN